MPNRANLLLTADLIERQPFIESRDGWVEGQRGFHMGWFKLPDNSPACICGWAAWIFHAGEFQFIGPTTMERRAHQLLGTNINEHSDLFFPVWHQQRWITPAIAAFKLRHLAYHDELCSWDCAKENA